MIARRAIHRLSRNQEIGRSSDEVFDFFSNAANLEALTPPFLHFRFLTELPTEMRTGARIEYALSLFGVPIRWKTRIVEWVPGCASSTSRSLGPMPTGATRTRSRPTATAPG